MLSSLSKQLTKHALYFLEPRNSTHRQYEALRAFFVDGLPSTEAATKFGYSPGSFRVLCSQFRSNPDRVFFVEPSRGPQAAPKKDAVREQVIALRKQNLSIYDISQVLEAEGKKLNPVSVSKILKEEGFAKLPMRRDEERPVRSRPTAADVADARKLDLSPRRLHTRFGGLFLFIPYLASIPLEKMLDQAQFPGSQMVPSAHAIRSLLALKMFGNARRSHVMSHVFDEGLALFAGLNTIPKRSFLTEYSCRIKPDSHPVFMKLWFDFISKMGLQRGNSFDLDFHTIPFHGEDALIEKHYVSKRSRRQKGVLAFLAQDGDNRVFCYANADLRKSEQNDEILCFVDFWQQRTGSYPKELIFDSKLTTYANLNRLNLLGIQFMTLRRRSKKMMEEIRQRPNSAWRKIQLEGVSRTYKTPKILDEKITLKGYEGSLRQLTITDLGHELPTILITNQMTRSPSKLIGRYAQRMLIENGIADGIDFFHMDALSSAVAMKVNCDLQLTLMASSLYKLLSARIGNGYETAKTRHIFRDFIEASANITLTKNLIKVSFQKRAHNPLLLAAGFAETDITVPWLEEKRLHFSFG
jgi:hypothetical protein